MPTATMQRLAASDATALDGASAPWLANDVDGRPVEIRSSAEYDALMERRQRATKDAASATAGTATSTLDALTKDGEEVFLGAADYDRQTSEPGAAADSALDLDADDVFTE